LDDSKVNADYEFQRVQKLYPKLILPQKAYKRVSIEHINRDCKLFNICANRYCDKAKKHHDTGR
jgi:hypothetical protein